jgi:hypothetical protein
MAGLSGRFCVKHGAKRLFLLSRVMYIIEIKWVNRFYALLRFRFYQPAWLVIPRASPPANGMMPPIRRKFRRQHR